jgi:hypothetical protein
MALDRPKDYARYVRSLHGRFIEVIVRKQHVQRSARANRYYFGVVVPLIAEHCGYEKDEMHELLAMKFLRMEDDPVTGSPRRKRTPDTDTKEFAEYVDACIRLGAELGVVIPEPGAVAA